MYVSSALPGDTLQIEVLEVEVAEWGWTGIIPGFGLLADKFPDPALKIWTLNRTSSGAQTTDSPSGYGYAWFDEKKGIKIPLKPFAGEMGVAPAEKGAFPTIPPYKTGGNIDTKHLTKGSILYLPIGVEGALFSIGVSSQGSWVWVRLTELSLGWACVYPV